MLVELPFSYDVFEPFPFDRYLSLLTPGTQWSVPCQNTRTLSKTRARCRRKASLLSAVARLDTLHSED